MIEPDGSESECVGQGPFSDASDAFGPSGSCEEVEHDDTPARFGSPLKQGSREDTAEPYRGYPAAVSGGRSALLDTSSPPGSIHLHEQDPRDEEGSLQGDAEPFECAIAREVHYTLWPLLAAHQASDLMLVSLSLTTTRMESLLDDGALFVSEIGARPGEGVLLARDLGPAHGRGHFYGPALTSDAAQLCARWCTLTGAVRLHARMTPVTGWPGDASAMFKQVAGVLTYTFKPWPEGFGRRSLSRDVLASGVFAAPWKAAHLALTRGLVSASSGPEKASGKRRTCPRCGADFLPRKRSHAHWCSKSCRQAAWEQKHPGRKRPRSEDAPDEPE